MIAARPVKPRAPVAVADGELAGALDGATGADDAGTTGTALVLGLAEVDWETTGVVGLAVGFAANGGDLCEPCVATTATTATAAAAPTAVAATIGFEICRAFATFVAEFVSL
jgi:hypothetical protein